MNKQNAPRIVFMAVVGVILAYGAIASFGYGFAGNDGQLNIASHTIEMDVETDGDIVTIVGNKNTVQRPQETQPETEQHKRGAWAFLSFFAAILAGLIIGFGIYYKVKKTELPMMSQKEIDAWQRKTTIE